MTDGPGGEAATRSNRTELISAVILGVAATLTAAAAFLSSQAGGDELAGFNRANSALADANFFYQKANQTQAEDNTLFVAYVTAIQEDDIDRADYLKELMRPEMQDAVAFWESSDDAVTPFDDIEDNPYTVDDIDVAEEEQAKSETALAEAEEAGGNGDKFDLANVVFAMALFAAGIVNLFDRRGLAYGLLGVATVMVVFGCVVMASGM